VVWKGVVITASAFRQHLYFGGLSFVGAVGQFLHSRKGHRLCCLKWR